MSDIKTIVWKRKQFKNHLELKRWWRKHYKKYLIRNLSIGDTFSIEYKLRDF